MKNADVPRERELPPSLAGKSQDDLLGKSVL